MKRLLALALVVAIAGCGAIKNEDAKIKERRAAQDAAIARMVVVQGGEIPGHARLTELGPVQGVCGRPPAYDDAQSAADQGFKHAAYAKYGDKVDGIIRVDSWFVIGNAASAVMEPGSAEGHFQCKGTAVHFEG